jgi:hypothetical protein
MAANAKTSTFDGKERTSIYIDLYQPESEESDKTVKVKTDDLSLLNKLNKEFAMGSVFKCRASVNAYKNQAYYKLISL